MRCADQALVKVSNVQSGVSGLSHYPSFCLNLAAQVLGSWPGPHQVATPPSRAHAQPLPLLPLPPPLPPPPLRPVLQPELNEGF